MHLTVRRTDLCDRTDGTRSRGRHPEIALCVPADGGLLAFVSDGRKFRGPAFLATQGTTKWTVESWLRVR
jgi:hypothetical protein